jgi:hypothetical protein
LTTHSAIESARTLGSIVLFIFGGLFMSTMIHRAGFDIRQHLNFDAQGRTACPACTQDGKTNQKNLSVDLDTGAYRCWRGCTSEQIRDAIAQPKPQSDNGFSDQTTKKLTTVSQQAVAKAVEQLQTSPEALNWLQSRGFTQEMIAHYRIGLADWRDSHPAIAIHIPSNQDGKFYRKLRIMPWVEHNLPKWSQYGVSTTIFQTYSPNDAIATWFCEGEWDAMRLGWLAQQQNAKVTVCCSTTGCGAVPSIEQLNQLPGEVFIFFDRNDTPTKSGVIPGDEGARKFAQALGDRARIAQVPMPDDCTINGWDISNAIDAGFTWTDFEQATQEAITMPKAPSLKATLTELLDNNASPFDQSVELMHLAKQRGQPYRDLDHLAKTLTAEQNQQTEQIESADRLQELLRTQEPNLNLHEFLEPWFADILIQTAKAMPTAPEFLFTTLLPSAASCIGSAAQVIIKPSAKYKQPMVFWSAIVANSGSMKTPAQRVILDPLVDLEKQAYEAYKTELADYEYRKAAGENVVKPIRKRYLTKDATLETLQRIHSDNPRGILYYRDEMAGAIKGRDQYRKGRGADEEAELDQWTGAAIIVDRADKATCLPNSAISRTGSIQWEVLGDLMGDHRDANGAWSRWLFCAADAPVRYLSLPQEETDTGISETLIWLYSELEKLPTQDYFLDHSAKRMFEYWQRQLVDEQQTQQTFGLQLVYPKIEAYTARLALWLHIVNAVLRREAPAQMISGLTMGRAIQLAAYYLWQHRLIHTHNSPDAGIAGIALKIHKYVERVGEASASKLKSGVRVLRNMAADRIRQLMQTLASSGYGKVQGNGSDMTYCVKPPNQKVIDTIDPENPITSIPLTPVPSSIAAEIDQIDTAAPPIDQTPIRHQTQPSINPLPVDATASDLRYENGSNIEVWRDGQWLPGKYLNTVIHSVLSHITRKLDDGHLVTLAHAPSSPTRVADTDLRPLRPSPPYFA